LQYLISFPFQGENGDLKNRRCIDGGGLKVEINHIGNLGGGVPGGVPSDSANAAATAAADFPDSSIGEGMDITIQGVNGHVKHNDSESLRSHSTAHSDASAAPATHSVGSPASEKRVMGAAMDTLPLPSAGGGGAGDDDSKDFSSDMSIGRGMDISIRGEGDTGNKESCAERAEDWNDDGVQYESSKEQLLDDCSGNDKASGGSGSDAGGSGTHSRSGVGDDISYDEGSAGKNVDEVVIDPIDGIVVEECCPEACYRMCPCCIGDVDSPFWQLWAKNRLQMSR
jgi:hypothetical protein